MARNSVADERSRQRGYALVLTLFLLASAATVGLVVMGNGVAARKMAHAASVTVAVKQRAAAATWLALDAFMPGKGNPRRLDSVSVDGFSLSIDLLPESGRIGLNDFSVHALDEALQALGIPAQRSLPAAQQIYNWRRGDSPSPVTAFWSIDDLDFVPDLPTDIRSCLRQWGSVYSRGSFWGKQAIAGQFAAAANLDGGASNVVVGTTLRLIVTDQTTGERFRSIMLYRGTSRDLAAGRADWLIFEWLQPTSEIRDACPDISPIDNAISP